MPKIRVTLGIGFAGCTHRDELDIDEEEWAGCTNEEERSDLINSYWADWSNNFIDGGAELVGEGEDE